MTLGNTVRTHIERCNLYNSNAYLAGLMTFGHDQRSGFDRFPVYGRVFELPPPWDRFFRKLGTTGIPSWVSTNSFCDLLMGKAPLAKTDGLVAQLLLRLRFQFACISLFHARIYNIT